MRRLLLLVSALVLVDTMLYAVLTPLLPHFADDLGLSKGQAGVLVGAYAAGALVGGLPGGVAAARMGARRAVLVGLTLMGLSSLGFAFAGELLDAASERASSRAEGARSPGPARSRGCSRPRPGTAAAS